MVRNKHGTKIIFDINNKEEVRNYIIRSFRTRKSKKSTKLYRNIVKIYELYPKTVLKIINNIHNIGYWKDLFYILSYSPNEKLNKYIYKHILDQLNNDVDNHNNNEKMSTLPKWMPRQNSFFDKKFGFVDTFNTYLYPDEPQNTAEEKFKLRRLYRKKITSLSKAMDVTEIKLCEKRYNEINFDTIPYKCFQNNYKRFVLHCPKELYDHMYSTMSMMNIWEFFDYFYDTEIDNFKKDIITRVWNEKKNLFQKQINLLFDIDHVILLIDLSSELFKKSFMVVIVALVNIITEYNKNDVVFMNGPRLVKLEGLKNLSVVDRIELVKTNLYSYRILHVDELEKILEKNESILILTNKEHDNNNNKHIFWQLKLEELTKKVNLLQGLPQNKSHNKNLELITNIVHDAGELYDINYIYTYALGIVLVSFICFIYAIYL